MGFYGLCPRLGSGLELRAELSMQKWLMLLVEQCSKDFEVFCMLMWALRLEINSLVGEGKMG